MESEFPASFFKVLIDDFESRLCIPKFFVEIFDCVLLQSAQLQVKSGETWSVRIERIGEYYVFTDGWPKFVKDHDLKVNEFLVFKLLLEETNIIQVTIYGTSECRRDFYATTPIHDPGCFQTLSVVPPNMEMISTPRTEPSKEGSRKKKSKKIENDKDLTDDGGEPFTKVLTKFHRYKLNLSMEFVKKHGLQDKTEVKVQYMDRKSWQLVQLKWYSENSLLCLWGGWRDFLEDNALVIGKRYAFEFDAETDSIRVHPA